MVYRWVQLQGDGKTEALAQPQRPATPPAQSMAPRHLAWLFLRDPEQLEKQEMQTLSLIRKAEQVDIAEESRVDVGHGLSTVSASARPRRRDHGATTGSRRQPHISWKPGLGIAR